MQQLYQDAMAIVRAKAVQHAYAQGAFCGWPGAPHLVGGAVGYTHLWPAYGMGLGFGVPASVSMPVLPLGYGGGQALFGVGSACGWGYGDWSSAGGVARLGPSASGSHYQAARERMRQSVKGRADLDGQKVWASFESFMGVGEGDAMVATPDDVAAYLEEYSTSHGVTEIEGRKVVALSTVTNHLAHLKREFEYRGVSGAYVGQTGIGNPCTSELVSRWVRGYGRMLDDAGVEATAAVAMDEGTMTALTAYLVGKRDASTGRAKALLQRDLTLFVYEMASAQRGGEGTQLCFSHFSFDDRTGEIVVRPPTLKNRRGTARARSEIRFGAEDDFFKHYADLRREYAAVGWGVAPEDPVFRLQTGGPMTYDAFRQRLVGHLRGAGVDRGQTPHSFRRGKVTQMRDAGVDDESIKRLMLVSSAAMVQRYSDKTRPTRKRARDE
mmetsp:Transcript_37660/g.118746  ORF Transcript_37660/g.118746 Transcript_37660/m.118746 type:complete len:439 (-) Transcript_37660:85-1401(-)